MSLYYFFIFPSGRGALELYCSTYYKSPPNTRHRLAPEYIAGICKRPKDNKKKGAHTKEKKQKRVNRKESNRRQRKKEKRCVSLSPTQGSRARQGVEREEGGEVIRPSTEHGS